LLGSRCALAAVVLLSACRSPTRLPVNSQAALVADGQRLFTAKGCQACHGMLGKGGIVDENSITGSVPALATLAERLFLDDKSQADQLLAMLASGRDPSAYIGPPPFKAFPRTVMQLQNVRKIINEGSQPGRANPTGPPPKLVMPAWGGQLSAREVDSVIAYLVTLEDWER
jgi:mono/diheme cytochrome c family protein